jgi:hypothetical protein
MADYYGASQLYLNALHDFEEQGYCVVKGLLDPAALGPVRELVCTFTGDGHISPASCRRICPGLSFARCTSSGFVVAAETTLNLRSSSLR